MSCPTCSHTLHRLGCCDQTGLAFWWCPRCGTIKPCDLEAVAPALVDRCRKFGESLIGVCAEHSFQWERMGIKESILPEDKR